MLRVKSRHCYHLPSISGLMVSAALCSPPALATHKRCRCVPQKSRSKNLTVARADWSASDEAAPQPISVRRVVYGSGTLKRGRRKHQVERLHMTQGWLSPTSLKRYFWLWKYGVILSLMVMCIFKYIPWTVKLQFSTRYTRWSPRLYKNVFSSLPVMKDEDR